MWYNEIWILLLLSLTISCGKQLMENTARKFTSTELQHYWNLFKLRDVFLSALIKPDTHGILFKSEQEKQRLEINFDSNRVLTIVLPENGGWHKRVAINVDNQQSSFDLMVNINENSLLVFDGCKQIYSDQFPSLNFKLANPTIQLLQDWEGELPKNFQIGSGFPINQKCVKISTESAKYTAEDVEKAYERKPIDVLETRIFSFNDVHEPPPNFQGCLVDGKLLKTGESWTTNCTTCTCIERDEVLCRVADCPSISCSNPIFRHDSCCPSCGSQCLFEDRQSRHPHGEIFWPEDCYRCECWDGNVSCNTVNVTCKTPQCPKRDWVSESKYQCCPKCRDDASFCEMKPCHEYADCYNEKRGPKCVCKEGFYGNGTICMDVDECNFSADARAQLGGCMDGTTCKNKMGSFECVCLPGYQRLTDQICIPLLRV